jgi:hypothetical protein
MINEGGTLSLDEMARLLWYFPDLEPIGRALETACSPEPDQSPGRREPVRVGSPV